MHTSLLTIYKLPPTNNYLLSIPNNIICNLIYKGFKLQEFNQINTSEVHKRTRGLTLNVHFLFFFDKKNVHCF